jgi:ADP-heptose:LPS heptosyltransferase
LAFNPQNILVIDFGQLGDVVLSLPALAAIRRKFPNAKITAAVGKSCATVIDLANVADEKIIVDRVELRDGAKLTSVFKVARLVQDVRARKFDFVIDLHSLRETNILGFLSGAPKRLYAERESRSLDFLSNLRPAPEDKSKHATDRYLDVLKPLKIENLERRPKLFPRGDDLQKIEKLWQKRRLEGLVVGLFPGAGHPSRRWSLENFAGLADFLSRNDNLKIAVFLGPEEKSWANDVRRLFPKNAQILDDLSLPETVAALSRLSVFVSNDTGPAHLAAAVGIPLVVLLNDVAPENYVFMPRAMHLRGLGGKRIGEIEIEQVYDAVREMLAASRVESFIER